MSGLLSGLAADGLLDPAKRGELARGDAASLSSALAAALACAAVTCARPGADPPTAEELGAML
jgi:fructokinase